MRAMVFTGPGVVELLDIPEPVPSDGESVVTVAAAGICGSELHGIRTPGFRTPPLVMGHEFAGTVADGRRVVVNPIVACGVCDQCRRDAANLCRERALIGVHRAGAFAERVAVPTASMHEVPSDMAWDRAAAVEPLANAVHAWRVGGAGPEARVGVIGAGTIGLVCGQVARYHGVTDLMVVDVSDDRCRVVSRLLGAVTGPQLEGEFDVIFDAVGVPVTHRSSVERLSPGATAVWLGLIGDAADFDSRNLIRMEKRVVGTFAYTDAEFSEAIEVARTVDVSWVESFPLDHGPEIFMDLVGGRSDVVKAILRP